MFPCLLLAYSGQAAYLMHNLDHSKDAFYRSIPGLLYLSHSILEFPLVIHLCCLEYDQQPYIDTRVLSTLFLTHIPLLVVTCNLLKAIKFGKNH